MLGSQQGAPAAPPSRGGFEPPRPLSRPTTSEGGPGRGPVVLKTSAQPGGFGGAAAAAADEGPFSTAAQHAVSAAAAVADEAAASQMMMEGERMGGVPLAGPAGAALAGVAPMSGVMGKSALERLASESRDGIDSPGGGEAHPPFKSESDRRKHALDAKRRDLVETRMRPQQPTMPDVTEPRPPSQPRPDPRLGFAKPMSPRGLELEGHPPP